MAADSDTIFALASGAGRAAIGVIRISGAGSARLLMCLIGAMPPARRAVLRALRSADGAVLDRALVLWLPGPASYTGEDSVELHVHGGRAVLQGVTQALVALGARPAEAGEFTRRAFIQGRMDLLEAESVADLVNAETEAQRRQALRQMDGAQSRQVAEWAERMRRLVAWQEALIDFPDEDLPPDVEASLRADLTQMLADIEGGIADVTLGMRLRDGVVVAVTGAPNVGKSSLVNHLAQRDVAIVSPWPGTTRDALEVTIDLGGVPVTLIDTAGLRETDDPVEAEGVRRARARAETADVVLEVVDAAVAFGRAAGPRGILVANKVDALEEGQRPYLPGSPLAISVKTGQGMDAFMRALTDHVTALTNTVGQPIFTRMRHEAALRDAASALRAAQLHTMPELRGEELRLALSALGRLTGAVDIEMVLDLVFSEFCIGK